MEGRCNCKTCAHEKTRGQHPCGYCVNGSKHETRLGSCLDEAKACICGERQNAYGEPEDSFRAIASLWEAYFYDCKRVPVDITEVDVGHMMMLLKIARNVGQGKRDNMVDASGYAAIIADRLMGRDNDAA